MTARPMRLPDTLDDVTPEWLSEALSARWPGVRVKSVDVVDVIAATATKARLRVIYEDNGHSDAPESMVIKGGLFGHDHEQALAPLYHNEAIFYRDVAPRLPVEVPACFLALADDTDGVVVMEDLALAQATYGEGRRPIDAATVARGLDYQARYHARYWSQRSELDRLGLIDLRGFLSAFFGGMTPHFTIEEHAHHDPETLTAVKQAQGALADRTRFAQAVMTNWERNDHDEPCLIHFDTHLGNMYFDPTGTPGWLDWQLCGRGSWAWDIAYFMVGSMTAGERRTHERDLLEHYLGRLRDHGVTPPGTTDAWEAYRRNAIWGISWTLVPDVMQLSEDGYPIIERFLTAIRDLETMAALGLPAHGLWSH